MAYGEGADPRGTTLLTGTVIYGPGKILSFTSGQTGVDLCAAGEYAMGVSAGDSERAAGGALKTAAGATVSYYPLGGTLMIQSAAVTWEEGDIAYAGANGLVTNSNASSAKKMGIYVGAGGAAGSLGANGNGDTTNTEGKMVPIATAGYEVGQQ